MNNEIEYSRVSFDLYYDERRKIAGSHLLNRDRLKEDAFSKIYQKLLEEYENGKYPALTSAFLTTSLIHPEEIELWDVYLCQCLAEPDFHIEQDEIIRSFGKEVSSFDRTAYMRRIRKYIMLLHSKYFSQKKETSQEEHEIADLKKEIKKLREEKENLEQSLREGKEEIRKDLEKYQNEQRAAIKTDLEREKQAILKELKENPEYQLRFQETEQHNREIMQMVRERKNMETSLAGLMNQTSREFRNSTDKVAEDITEILKEKFKELASDTADKIEEFKTSTENAINSVADINRKLQNDDFKDLIHGYQKLEEQHYYKSRSGTDTQEYKIYWKNVSVYLKNFEKTLNKLGYSRIYPEIGSELDPETMEVFEDALNDETDMPEDDSEFKNYVVKEIVSSGFRDSSGYVEAKAEVIPAPESGFRQKGSEWQ